MARPHRFQIGGLFAATVLTTSALVLAQAPAPADAAAALKQSLAANQAALKTYSWVETTTISLKGEVKKQEQKNCYYGADGKVQKTPVPGAAAAPKQEAKSDGGGRRGGGRMKERIVENKVEELTEYMQKAAALVGEYVPPEAPKIQAAQAAGHFSVKPASGTVMHMTATDYVKAGDTLTIGIDSASKQLTEYNVKSYVEKPKDDDLTLNVTFGRLQDGTSYPQQIVLDVKAKNVQVKVVNSGYKKAS